ncbi:MAG: helix-turn-helix transcriptional regulator [Paracoccaceae bacterium]
MALADRLFDLRKKAGQSLQTVADAVGVSKAHIWDLEKRHTSNPSFELVQKLARHFGVTAETLIGAEAVPEPEAMQIGRIHRNLKGLSERDLAIVETLVHSMQSRSDEPAGD